MIYYESCRDENNNWFMTVTQTKSSSDDTPVVPTVATVIKALIDAPVDRPYYGKKDPIGVEEVYIKVKKFDAVQFGEEVVSKLNEVTDTSFTDQWKFDQQLGAFVVPRYFSEQK